MLLLMTHSTNILDISLSQLISEKGKAKIIVKKKSEL